ncbi:MAG: TRAP transporter large permease [Alphaproteobacteria bacterium]|nr:TRAP transporter large permease [Alphaproteobacteria bacterium]
MHPQRHADSARDGYPHDLDLLGDGDRCSPAAGRLRSQAPGRALAAIGGRGRSVIVVAVVLVVLLLAGLPISFSFALAAAALWWDGEALLNVVSKMMGGLDSFVLMAAPFYIVAGELMNRGGISERLIRLSQILVGRIRGGTAYAAVIAAIMFSGISGTAVADIAALGQIFINGMPKEGYSKTFAAALVTAASVIGPIIPPSVIMVLYAAVADISVLNLFLAGIVPGILLGVSCALVILWKGRHGDLPVSTITVSRAEVPRLALDGLLVMSLPAFIVIGTLSGAFTPTEAGGVAVTYAAFLGIFVFRNLTFAATMHAMRSAARLTAGLFLLIAAVEVVNYVLIIGGIADGTAALVAIFKDSPTIFLLVCVVALLIIGLALDAGPALLLLAPVLLPITRAMGIDDIHFSMVMIVSVTLGLISPPVGICLFVACKIGNITMRQLWLELALFFYAEIGVILVLVFFPVLSTGLPKLLRG